MKPIPELVALILQDCSNASFSESSWKEVQDACKTAQSIQALMENCKSKPLNAVIFFEYMYRLLKVPAFPVNTDLEFFQKMLLEYTQMDIALKCITILASKDAAFRAKFFEFCIPNASSLLISFSKHNPKVRLFFSSHVIRPFLNKLLKFSFPSKKE